MPLHKLKLEIRKLANPKKRKFWRDFPKTGKGQYGEGDVFLGIMVPNQRQMVKQYWRDLTLADVDVLLKSKFHEERLIALLILVKMFGSFCHPELVSGSKMDSVRLGQTE